MAKFNRKTYDNSYLYNKESNNHNKILADFIIKADRIEDKTSDAFRGIVEDVKRMQNSSVLYTVLMRDDVVLCINKNELSRAFKVFEAKDIRGDQQPKVFIDVTNLITVKDGYYVCKKIDWLITYLFNALGYLLYSKSTTKLTNNSNITIAATECFVAMFDYVPDYLRIIGYSQNKEKILYLAALYFLHNLMGKDIDVYVKNIAAKAAGISTSDTRAFELYYDADKDFMNIDSFVNLVASTFKLKGLTTEAFIHRWTYSFGQGSYFATELFTSFLSLMTSAFCGSYVVNQKQVERCCGASMVKLSNALLQLGISEFDNRGYMEASEFDKTIARDKNTEALKESFLKRNKEPKDLSITKDDCGSKSSVKEKMNKMVDFYKSSNQENKISQKVMQATFVAISCLNDSIDSDNSKYYNGCVEDILKSGKKYLNEKDKSSIKEKINKNIDKCNIGREKNQKDDKEKSKKYSSALVELRKCLAYV